MKIKLNNKTYEMKDDWYSITINDATKITELDFSGEKLDNLLDSFDLDYDDETMAYIIDVISILSNAPKEVLQKVENKNLIILFMEIKRIINYIYRYNFEQHKSLGIDEFMFNNKLYKIPSYLKVGDDIILFHKEASKNVLEVSNLMKIMEEMEHKGIQLLNYICAIYLREDVNETYDDEKINERAELFRELPLVIGYEVFFCIYYYMSYWAIISKIYLERKNRKIKYYLVKIKNIIIGFFKRLKVVWLKMLRKQKK